MSAKRPAVATAATDSPHVVHSREAMTTNEGPTAVGAAAPSSLSELERDDPFAPHGLGCQCYPHVSQRAAIEGAIHAATGEYREGLRQLARLRRIEAAALALDLRPERAVTNTTALDALRGALTSAQPTPGAARQPDPER